MLGQDLEGAVGGAVVHEDELGLRPRLPGGLAQAPDQLREIVGVVVHRHDDAQDRHRPDSTIGGARWAIR